MSSLLTLNTEDVRMTDEVRTTVSITVNGRSFEAKPGELLIEAAERAGDYIPRFCYHPRMEPVGICRMCLVEVDGPRGATLQPACYLKVTDGMSVVTDSEKVKKAQDGVLEFLLANHPLDFRGSEYQPRLFYRHSRAGRLGRVAAAGAARKMQGGCE